MVLRIFQILKNRSDHFFLFNCLVLCHHDSVARALSREHDVANVFIVGIAGVQYNLIIFVAQLCHGRHAGQRCICLAPIAPSCTCRKSSQTFVPAADLQRRALDIDNIRRLYRNSAGTPAGRVRAIVGLCRGRISTVSIALPVPHAALGAGVCGCRQYVGISWHIHRPPEC